MNLATFARLCRLTTRTHSAAAEYFHRSVTVGDDNFKSAREADMVAEFCDAVVRAAAHLPDTADLAHEANEVGQMAVAEAARLRSV